MSACAVYAHTVTPAGKKVLDSLSYLRLFLDTKRLIRDILTVDLSLLVSTHALKMTQVMRRLARLLRLMK